MFEWPELFGSPYILPAIIVVVVLLLVLVLLRMRAKRKTVAKAAAANETGAARRGAMPSAYESTGYGAVDGVDAGTVTGGAAAGYDKKGAAKVMKAERRAAQQAAKAEQAAAAEAEKAARAASKGRGRKKGAAADASDFDADMDYLRAELPDAEASAAGLSPDLDAGALGPVARPSAALGADALTPPPPPAAPAVQPPFAEMAPEAPTQGMFEETAPVETRSKSGYRGRAATQAAPRESVLPASDPLQTVIADILQGWGDLAAEDTNRLAVFRKEKVAAAIMALELPKDLKTSEYASARLTQLKRYVAQLERGEKTPVTPQDEFAAIGDTFIKTSGLQGADVSGLGAAAGAGAAAVGAAAGAWDSDEASAALDRAGDLDWGGKASEAVKDAVKAAETKADKGEYLPGGGTEAPWAPEIDGGPEGLPLPSPEPGRETVSAVPPSPPREQTLPTPPADSLRNDPFPAPNTTDEAVAAAAAAFWASPDAPPRPAESTTRPDVTLTVPQAPAPPPAPPPPVAPAFVAADAVPPTLPAPAAPPTPAPVKKSPLSVWDTEEQQLPPIEPAPKLQWEPVVDRPATVESTAPKAEIPAPTPSVPSHDDFLANLRGKISTAAGLMALPTADRKEMLVFLEPDELSKVFRTAGQDSELKKAVIDTLESIGTPPALDVLHTCLDDPDPEVQMRALDAADRLLGAG